MKKAVQKEPIVPPKPIARRLDVKALKQTIELVDKEELSKALAGRSVDSVIEGAVQLFNVSVADQHYDKSTWIALSDIDFLVDECKYTMRWCVDNSRIVMMSPAQVCLHFSAPSKAYYLIGVHAARFKGGDYKADYNLYLPLPGIKGSFNMKDRPLMKFDPPLPVLAYIDDLTPNRFWFSGHYVLFESISVWKL